MMKKKYLLPIVGAVIVLTALIAVKLTLAYLTDTETANNVITVGKAALKIDEGSYVDESVLAAGQKLAKAPKIINTGTIDEYVFFKVGVPKGEVTLLHESGDNEGKPAYEKGKYELFKLLASSAELTVSDIPNSDDPKKVIVKYHSGDSENGSERAGWIYLSNKTDITDPSYDYYVFGYNQKLIAGKDESTNTTVTLFDEIQLKSFIDEELGNNNSVKVDVTAYGIQTDELGYSGEYLVRAQLEEIWDILERKQVKASGG